VVPVVATDSEQVAKPSTRGECANIIRPCPYVSCRHNLYLEVDKKGGIVERFSDPSEVPPNQSCTLDIVDEFGMLDPPEIGRVMGLTPHAVGAIEAAGLRNLRSYRTATKLYRIRRSWDS